MPAEAQAIAEECHWRGPPGRRAGRRHRRTQALEVVRGAVDHAFIAGWYADSWVSFVVVLLEAFVAVRFLPARATAVPADASALEAELASAVLAAPVPSAVVTSTAPAWSAPTSVDEVAAALTATATCPTRAWPPRCTWPSSLRRPLLLEGEAGVGKTEVAKVLAAWTGGELIRLQCYEGIDAAQAVYDWDYGRQLLHLRAAEASGESAGRTTDALEAELYHERFLVKRALLRAIEPREGPPPVLLIDEIDRADDEFEAYLLEVLSDWQITIPELGCSGPTAPPMVILTSNRTRDVHDALKRAACTTGSSTPTSSARSPSSACGRPEVGEPLARQVAAAVDGAARADAVQAAGRRRDHRLGRGARPPRRHRARRARRRRDAGHGAQVPRGPRAGRAARLRRPRQAALARAGR